MKEFYKKLLEKDNQKFLLELAKGTATGQSNETNSSAATNQNVNERTQIVTLALRTLANYDFSEFSFSIVYFIENSVLNYLDDENP